MNESRASGNRRRIGILAAIAAICAALVFLVTGLLTSIFERKQEAKNPYVRLVEVSEETTDPAAWGVNWAREYRLSRSPGTRQGHLAAKAVR